ncbi:hypothetical protein [Oleiagrimonas sp. MCCC 1A03011]|uniref:hypothetical protein n=1 Tax=Oleiagrimonas sp. MCCC 1A03011 TaxID=1926883 RepID=UPI000DC3A03C|nr:hypothetical protein [Oleiagrimonas sp. MCCC 1A03011]RAP57637.1 hypothetical protein BTJ49_06940 [Oleiagrimonas sp. MCCC 1A03011]
MHFDIQLRFQPSPAFIGILADMNERYADWTDGSYDWANQTEDFLATPAALPDFDESLLQTPLSKRAVNDTLQIAIALLSGNYPLVRDYLKDTRFAFVIGYPRSGGSYLTKELLRTIGLEHTHVSEALAHDGFPDLRETWYDWAGDRPYYHLQHSVFEVAEFLVIAHLYYQRRTAKREDGLWLVPKKMHKMVAWAGSFKMLLGQGRADYIMTVRHPVPACISIYEKGGELPADGLFPMAAPRSAIEHWVINDLMHLGHSAQEIARMPYIDAVLTSWSQFHLRMAGSGLFLGDRNEIRIVPYGKSELETVVRDYRAAWSSDGGAPEPVHVHDKAAQHPDWIARGDAAVDAVARAWASLGLPFPKLSLR